MEESRMKHPFIKKWSPETPAAFYLVVLTLFTASFFLHHAYPDNLLFSSLQILSGVPLVFFSGSAFVVISQVFLRRTFDLWEFLALAILASILLFPTLLLAEMAVFGYVYVWFPLANILAVTLPALLFLFNKKTNLEKLTLSKKEFWISSPFFLFLLSYSFLSR
jgi:hypothetical protein